MVALGLTCSRILQSALTWNLSPWDKRKRRIRSERVLLSAECLPEYRRMTYPSKPCPKQSGFSAKFKVPGAQGTIEVETLAAEHLHPLFRMTLLGGSAVDHGLGKKFDCFAGTAKWETPIICLDHDDSGNIDESTAEDLGSDTASPFDSVPPRLHWAWKSSVFPLESVE